MKIPNWLSEVGFYLVMALAWGGLLFLLGMSFYWVFCNHRFN